MSRCQDVKILTSLARCTDPPHDETWSPLPSTVWSPVPGPVGDGSMGANANTPQLAEVNCGSQTHKPASQTLHGGERMKAEDGREREREREGVGVHRLW